MPYQRSMISRVSTVALPYLIVFSFFPGSILSAVVTLRSFELYNTHEWIPRTPAIYFQCNGENRTFLPDVQEPDVLYNFKGEESWQPLTELLTAKCKRCGIYEQSIVSDHVFDEWELCPSDFAAPEGQYTRFKENEFNVTFLCKECFAVDKDSEPTSKDSQKGSGGEKHIIVPILVTIVVVAVVASISVAGCKYWRKKKRQQDQARFLKLFEDDDDIEGEFGLTEMLVAVRFIPSTFPIDDNSFTFNASGTSCNGVESNI
ncbi:hypothetical protein V2J09_010422 [Rumex salicifolius]